MKSSPQDYPPSSPEALAFIRDALHTKQSRREFMALVVAVIGLLVAYIPYGVGIVASFFAGAWLALLPIFTTSPFDARSVVVPFWMIVVALTGNLQIVFSLIAFRRKSIWLQNPIAKVGTLVAQLYWCYPGVILYFWYAWVASSALLFMITPLEHFSWENIKGRKPSSRLPADDVYP
ncbi:MAG: hypothetical protein IPN71_06225 [Fibrobacteres bacterium]|nr:hypothetical protein [Fibrobacterota bacterium]